MLLVGYTLRVACRLGASTGCWGGLCPFPCTPILSHIYRAAHRCSPYNTILYARYAAYARLRYAMPWRAGSSVCGGFFMGEYGRIWENMREYGNPCRLLPHLRAVVCVAADAACFKSLKIGVWVYSFDMSNSILLVIMPLAPMAMKLRASAGSSE